MPAMVPHDNSVMEALKRRMKEMDISREQIDQHASVSSDAQQNGINRHSSVSEQAAPIDNTVRPKIQIQHVLAKKHLSVDGPAFKMTLERGANPSDVGDNYLMESLKQSVEDRSTPGYRAPRKPMKSKSTIFSTLENIFKEQDQGYSGLEDHNLSQEYCGLVPVDLSELVIENNNDPLPPPPEDLLDGSCPVGEYYRPSFGNQAAQSGTQSRSFKKLQNCVDANLSDEVPTIFNTKIPAYATKPNPQQFNKTPDICSGPNFKINKAAAPTYKPNPFQAQDPPKQAPVPVNRAQHDHVPQHVTSPRGSYSSPASPPHGGSYSSPARSSPQPQRTGSYSSPAHQSPQPPHEQHSANRVMTRGSPQPKLDSPKGNLMCHACQQQLAGPFVSAIGKTWHPEHFCCSACNMSLQNQAFVEENNKLFCEKCYNQYYAPKCAQCNCAIIGNCVNALGKSWHPDHFVCQFCSKSFGSDGFLVDSGKPYCEKCFEDLFSVKCGKCDRPITGGEKYVEALGKNWHSVCFNCTVCDARLEGNSFFVNNGQPYCIQHKSGV